MPRVEAAAAAAAAQAQAQAPGVNEVGRNQKWSLGVLETSSPRVVSHGTKRCMYLSSGPLQWTQSTDETWGWAGAISSDECTKLCIMLEECRAVRMAQVRTDA